MVRGSGRSVGVFCCWRTEEGEKTNNKTRLCVRGAGNV